MILRLLLLNIIFSQFYVASSAFGGINCPTGVKINLEDKKDFKEVLGHSVFQVMVVSEGPPRREETIGTATLVSDEGYLLTAAHIFETDDKRILKGIDSKELRLLLRIPVDDSEHLIYDGQFVEILSEKYDLSIIKLSNWDRNRKFKPAWLDVKSNPHDNEARLMGYIVSEKFPTVSEKGNILRLSNTDGYLRATSLSAYQGYSGSLLISDDGMGIAVLSGKFVKSDDDKIDWGEIGDMENGALNAAPLTAVINELSNLELNKANHLIEKLNKSSKTISSTEINDLIKYDRLAAIAIGFRLKDIGAIKGLENRENKWNMLRLAECLLPPGIAKDIYFRMDEISSSVEEKKWFSKEVVNHALKEARETDDLAHSIVMYDLAIAAIGNAEFDEAYTNYAYLDYYKTAVKADTQGVSLATSSPPSAIIGAYISKISDQDSNVTKTTSVSRSLLFSAATAELNKKGNFYDAAITAKAALKTAEEVNANLQTDWVFMNNKAIISVSDKSLRDALIVEKRVITATSLDKAAFTKSFEQISAPSNTQVINSVNKLSGPQL